MDFFERQARAHRNTKLLAVYFVAGVAVMILAIYAAALAVFAWSGSYPSRHHYRYESSAQVELWNPKLFLGVTFGTLAVIAIGSMSKSAELAQGGSAVATLLGGRLVNSNTTDSDERKLLNVVEEMALAAGIPVPQVYLLEDERGINAFAAGHSTSDAAVAVTRGCMKLLTRDELQGVIGHEFSHILNGDMRLNLRLMGIIFGILCLTVIGRILLQTRGRKNPLPVLGIILLLFGSIGVFFGRLIQAAVSRQREFLADASSVQFTRNPAGLAGALKKIGGLSYGSRLIAAHADEASHMYFGNGGGAALFGLLATHPPLEQRILAIDPAFDGVFPPVDPVAMEKTAPPTSAPRRRPPIPFPIPGMPQFPASAAGIVSPVIAAQAVLPDLGTPTTEHLQYAFKLRDSIPPRIQEAARDPLGAAALIYSLVISPEPELQQRQLELLARCTSSAVRQETERLLPEVAPLAVHARLPLVDLALPALRQFSPRQYQEFHGAVQQLVESDNEIDLFEYVLQKITLRHLSPHFESARRPVIQYYALRPLLPDCGVLLSALSHVGSDDPAAGQAAFDNGASRLADAAGGELSYLPAEQCDLTQVDAALNRLSQAAPQLKKAVLDACAQTVAADGVIQEMEAELLRAVADTLDCPIPPFIR